MSKRPANDEMIEGYLDGFDLSSPEPSDNRSHSYRHGFKNGRADKFGRPWTTAQNARELAGVAMAMDDVLARF